MWSRWQTRREGSRRGEKRREEGHLKIYKHFLCPAHHAYRDYEDFLLDQKIGQQERIEEEGAKQRKAWRAVWIEVGVCVVPLPTVRCAQWRG